MEDSIKYLATQNIKPLKQTTDEAIYRCFLSCKDDKKGHLYISKKDGRYFCHKCKEKGNLITLKKHFNNGYEKQVKKTKAKYIWDQLKDNDKSQCTQYLLDRYISRGCIKSLEDNFRFNEYNFQESIAFPVIRDGKIISLSFKPLSGRGTIFLKGCSVSGGHWPKLGSGLKKTSILVESCVNAMTLYQLPHFRKRYTIISALSSSNIPNILDQFDKVLIYIDNDDPSMKWAQKIKDKYPDKVVKRIVWPKGKPQGYDVNDLAKELKDPTKIEKALRKLKFTRGFLPNPRKMMLGNLDIIPNQDWVFCPTPRKGKTGISTLGILALLNWSQFPD